MEIIRLGMNDHRFSDNLSHMEPPGENPQISVTMIGQQRRQIPCMIRMRCFAGIEMAAGIGKSFPFAILSLMDVECKEAGFSLWKSGHHRFHHHAVLSLKESHNSMHPGIFAVALNPCYSTEKAISHQSIAPK